MDMTITENSGHRMQDQGSKLGGPIKRQLTFDWSKTNMQNVVLKNGGNEYLLMRKVCLKC